MAKARNCCRLPLSERNCFARCSEQIAEFVWEDLLSLDVDETQGSNHLDQQKFADKVYDILVKEAKNR